MRTIARLLGQRTLVCDGAMGTVLHAAGNSLDQALVALNLSDPGLVRSVHDSYVEAGVDILQTNTFGGSRLRLANHGYSDAVADINRAGVAIARAAADAAGRQVFVAGSVSPAVTVRQRAKTTATERRAALRSQIGVLAGAGVDLIALETFGYLDELVEAIEVATEVTDLPLVAQATFSTDGLTLSGHGPEEIAATVVEAAGDRLLALGVNCTLGPQGSLSVLERLAEHAAVPLSVQPNAGLPRRVASSRFEYEVDVDYFARYAKRMVAAGAAIVGGCCGTTPEHIRAVAAAVSAVVAEPAGRLVTRARRRSAPEVRPPIGLFGDSGFVVGGHLSLTDGDDADPARRLADLARRASDVRRAGVNVLSVRTEPGARARISAVSAATQFQQQEGIPVLTSVSTVGKTIMALQANLLGAHARGVHRIICESGSPALVGDYPNADGRWEVDSVGLVELLVGLNAGVDHNGLRLAGRTSFEIGAWVNSGARDLEAELRRTRAKVEAGVHFLVTRPIYEVDGLERLAAAVDGRVPVLVSLHALRGFEEAEFLRHEVPDVAMPDAILSILEHSGAAARRVGVELAVELAERARGLVQGVLVDVDDDTVALSEVLRLVRPKVLSHRGSAP
ncbi:bifunctional homocysteine S-methyltransferase/methylenetetrahydrofolate reductase [Rhizomonospora bruguierae]|uniref:bifunctional homocysteine S-methyltransferase/methylenetetrahydrofolate reductase n=1 Tax=Rhizomonospora bruguierae TaxID=1581705 RepID=UPI001BCE7950|nr:bifunctional homocysteine S-methyltransferase/methylenetetrahydrofolate reductase [Micromonospora sp. NBRC 107566]